MFRPLLVRLVDTHSHREAARLDGAEFSFRLVQHPQFTLPDRKVTAEHNQGLLLFALHHEWEGPEIRHASADRCFFEPSVRFAARAVLLSDSLGNLVDLAHPPVNKAAFTDPSIAKPAGQDGRYAA